MFEGSGQPLTLREIPLPTPGIGQWLVRNEYTTLCASDLHTFNGKRQERTPTILGHEITGQLVAAGPGAPTTDANGAPLLPGTKVTWAIYASDPGSELALRGIPQKGDQLFKYGHELLTETHTLHGGLSEYTLLRQHTPIIALPNDLPATVAALVNCSVATTCGAFRLAGAITSRSILITGGGMLGLVACALANENGAVNITVADNQPSRLATSLKFGAKEATTLQQVEGKFDVVMDFTGVPEVMEQSLHKLAIGGTAIWVGAAMPGTPVPPRLAKHDRPLGETSPDCPTPLMASPPKRRHQRYSAP
ncbi:MAG: hypothetical protein EBZ77_09565, partial [Chitinophagia bacterium]|nr:hypothetical protein [Chitinophagia bacterium]